MSARGFVETAPRAFELALHFVAALRQGAFGMVLAHAWAAGHPLDEVSGVEITRRARGPLEALVAGEFAALSAKTWVGTFGNGDGAGGSGDDRDTEGRDTEGRDTEGRDTEDLRSGAVEALAVVDAALAGAGWFAAGRFVWSAADFGAASRGRSNERLVVAVDDPHQEALRVVRLRPDDDAGRALMASARQTVLRELVVRPAFTDRTLVAVGAAGGELPEDPRETFDG